jgi:replication factor C large subunit
MDGEARSTTARDWTATHRPRTLGEIRGNDSAVGELREWADTWDDHREAVVIHGSPGIGKTSAAHALAADRGWDVMELNASDQRTGDVIERVAGEAAASATLTGDDGASNRRLIVLDEADNLHGNKDRGGARAMTNLVKEANQPIVLVANAYYDMSQGLRGATQDIEFRDLREDSIVAALRDICRKEDIEYESAALEAIAAQVSGDLRSAVNDLQALAETTERLTEDDVVTGERDRETGIFDFLDIVLKEGTPQEALETAYDVDETPDDLLAWVEDNAPKDYAGAELAAAYRYLANADRWLGRVHATQNYTYWRYATDNIAGGVAAAREGRKGGWTRYGPPSYWSKLGRTSGTRTRRDEIARQISIRADVSIATARQEVLPRLAAMTHHCKPRELTVAMAAAYDLDADDIAHITGSGADTNKVATIVEDATERRAAAATDGTGDLFVPDETTADEDRSDENDGQLSLAAANTDDEDSADGTDDPDGAADDGQSGLDDFM